MPVEGKSLLMKILSVGEFEVDHLILTSSWSLTGPHRSDIFIVISTHMYCVRPQLKA